MEKVLNLNQAPAHHQEHDPSAANGLIPKATPILSSDGEPIWKVLVFDDMGRDVISSVLRVNDLRSWGVTIHLYVESIANARVRELCVMPMRLLIDTQGA